jgi:hypothetical protein
VVQGTAVELFQLASLLMADQVEAIALAEATLASVEIDPCLDPAATALLARKQVVALGLARLREVHPGSFAGVPHTGSSLCVEDEDLGATSISHAQLAAWLASDGRRDLRDWLAALPGAQRVIFVQRAVLGESNETVAASLTVGDAAPWTAMAVGEVYRLALCSLANSLAHAPAVLAGSSPQGMSLGA